MLKRLSQRYANVRDDAELREELGFVPTEEELRHPEATPGQLAKLRDVERSPNKFICKLCPEK